VGFVCAHPAGLAQHPLVSEHTATHSNRAEAQKMHHDAPLCVSSKCGVLPIHLRHMGWLGLLCKICHYGGHTTSHGQSPWMGKPHTTENIRKGMSLRPISRGEEHIFFPTKKNNNNVSVVF